jgi:hypothetical protein
MENVVARRSRPSARPGRGLAFLALLVAGVLMPAPAVAQSSYRPGILPTPRDPSLPSIFYIGDSTMRNGDGTGKQGLWGWADESSV